VRYGIPTTSPLARAGSHTPPGFLSLMAAQCRMMAGWHREAAWVPWEGDGAGAVMVEYSRLGMWTVGFVTGMVTDRTDKYEY